MISAPNEKTTQKSVSVAQVFPNDGISCSIRRNPKIAGGTVTRVQVKQLRALFETCLEMKQPTASSRVELPTSAAASVQVL